MNDSISEPAHICVASRDSVVEIERWNIATL